MIGCVRFKSVPEIWLKEQSGRKRNTVRKFGEESDKRKEILDCWQQGIYLDVEILNTETKEVFVRRVMDVTRFDNYYIISW